MAEAVVNSVVERLGSLLIEEANFLYGVGGQVESIRDELRKLQGFLKDADARQHEDQRVHIWLQDVRGLAYEAGDVLDCFILRVASNRKEGIINILKRFVCILNESIAIYKIRSKIRSEIQVLKASISEITTRLQTYGIRSEGESSSSTTSGKRRQLRRTYSHVGEEKDFVGLEDDVEKLVAYLVNDEPQNSRVVSICGMGGSGKTTLARRIYKHSKVKLHFATNSAWVCISRQWQTKEILQGILIKLIPEQRKEIVKWRDDALKKKLFQMQQEKRYLIVLDNIWSTDSWNCISAAFPTENSDSKILLICKIKVARHVNPKGFLHKLRLLNEDESLELFQKKAFQQRDGPGPGPDVKHLEELGRKMVRDCRGLPLAVVMLGGLLATKQTLNEWEMVHNNIKSYRIRGNNRRIGVFEILALSYNDLPYHLKPCFIYLGKFKEDYDIEAEKLYQLWMAENFVLSEDRREEETMMNVAESYLGELAHRGMVNVQLEEEESPFRKFSTCSLHEPMRDLCLVKAKEEDILETIYFRRESDRGSVISYSSDIANTRRLYINWGSDEDIDITSRHKQTSRHLRSLIFFGEWGDYGLRMPHTVSSHLNDFKMLRVLAIEGFKIGRGLEIGNLIHLRYLSLRGTSFIKFPSTIANLEQLQTLDLQLQTHDEPLFFSRARNVLGKMGRLQHLYLPCPVKIRSTCKLQFNGLSNLETLENFSSTWCDVNDLVELTNLRKLTALVSTKLEDLEMMINYLVSVKSNHLQHSSLAVDRLDFCSAKGSALIRKLLACPNLHQLYILGRIDKLPGRYNHFNYSPSLTKLFLWESKLEEDPMEENLEKLPNLRILVLRQSSFVGKEMVCSATGFPQLKSLKLFDLPNFEKWRVDEGAMPNLSSLHISGCPKLEMLPDGFKFLSALQELRTEKMPKEFNSPTRASITTEDEEE